jgi:hypothetical protein
MQTQRAKFVIFIKLFVIQQPGDVRILQDAQLSPTPFLDIRDRVGSNGSERGLLGIAFHPNFQESGYFYVDYTDKNGNTNISRFKVSANADQAGPASEKVLLHILQPFANHNGSILLARIFVVLKEQRAFVIR